MIVALGEELTATEHRLWVEDERGEADSLRIQTKITRLIPLGNLGIARNHGLNHTLLAGKGLISMLRKVWELQTINSLLQERRMKIW